MRNSSVSFTVVVLTDEVALPWEVEDFDAVDLAFVWAAVDEMVVLLSGGGP